ncbi:carbohydrate ABC transporter permease [Variovorax ginsengisoli]|uniref:Multiple sugar transport system permease protein n=1 Tax=Variovorax ginsengisoli TaxID=363844 RepID=A0ABT9S4L6_9BURK|nr:sugar ABC transporter permease [Variovorax ginsengisoli]MDP9899286.1 multiple sugar transport system permease protein [Variovorax ginsengisoli]
MSSRSSPALNPALPIEASATGGAQRRSSAGSPAARAQRALAFTWMMWPAIGFVAAMIVFPLVYAAWLSLYDASLGSEPRFVGIDNYLGLLTDREFRNAFWVTWALYGGALAMQMVLGTWLGIVLNNVKWARNLVCTIAITPFMLPPVVVAMMAMVLLDPSVGIVNWVIGLLGIPPQLWLAHPKWVLATVALIDTWQWAPFVALLVLGGLQSLPTTVFEAAEVDGVVGWRRLVYITIPLLGPTLLTAAVLRSVDLLRFFDLVFIATRGGPGNASTTLNMYAYQQGFEFSRFGWASASMITLSLVVLCTVIVFARLRRAVAW